MSRARLVFIFGFLISLAAGFVVGMAVGRAPTPAQATTAPTARSHHVGPRSLDDELDLTPQQRAKVHEIFSGLRPTSHGGRNGSDPFMSMVHERDEAIHQLVPAERQADYDRIIQEWKNKLEELKNQRELQIKDAEQKMKAVLTSEQWAKFEKIKREHGVPPPMGRGRGPRPQTTQSATGPWAGHGLAGGPASSLPSSADGPPAGSPPPDESPQNRGRQDRP